MTKSKPLVCGLNPQDFEGLADELPSEFMVEPIHGEKPRLVIPTKIELEQMSEYYTNRVKFNDIKSAKIKHFISCSDIYAVVFGYIYNSISETYPTIEDIEHEYSKLFSNR